jgi:hypothetical protein
MYLSVTGAEDLGVLAKRLKEVGDKELKKELLRGIRAGTKGTHAKIRASARMNLPKRGGLAEIIAKSKISTKTRMSGRWTGINIKATSKHDVASMNRGSLRHPIFGRSGKWDEQPVPVGWFTHPIEADADTIRAEIQKVMADVAAKLERN